MTVTSREWNEVRIWPVAVVKTLGLYLMEMAVFFIFFAAYFFLRGAAGDDVASANANALKIIDTEKTFGIFHEAAWQQAALPHKWLMDMANITYMHLHLNLLLVMGFFFFLTDRKKYRVLRNALLLSAFIGIPFYHFFPVTPPRLLAEHGMNFGFVDTLVDWRRPRPGSLANWYAAVPSYHFGWILLLAIGTWWCWCSPYLRAAMIAFAAFMWFSIVVTGNHYFLDMVIGALIVSCTFIAAYTFERWTERHPGAIRRFTLNVQGVRIPF